MWEGVVHSKRLGVLAFNLPSTVICFFTDVMTTLPILVLSFVWGMDMYIDKQLRKTAPVGGLEMEMIHKVVV